MTNFRFSGNGAEFFKIWIVNVLLTIVTLGLYYPWAKVRTRRYFYGNTSLDSSSFEYHATGKQLFLSYFIAMILLVIYVITQNAAPEISAILFLVFILALPWLIWKSLMFNMRMMSFANVRFKFEGTRARSYLNYLGYPLLFLVAAGLVVAVGNMISPLAAILVIPLYVYAMAFLKKVNTEYRIDNSRYGHGAFKTNIELNPLVMISLKAFGVFIFASLVYLVIVSMFGGLAMGQTMLEMKDDPEAMQENIATLMLFVGVIYAGFILVGMFTYAYAMARFRTYIFANTTLNETIEFNSSLSARTLTWVIFSNLVLLILTLGLAKPWTQVRMARAVVENTQVKADESIESFTSQAQQHQSAIGEELGDAFDVDVGVAL